MSRPAGQSAARAHGVAAARFRCRAIRGAREDEKRRETQRQERERAEHSHQMCESHSDKHNAVSPFSERPSRRTMILQNRPSWRKKDTATGFWLGSPLSALVKANSSIT